MKKVVGIGGCVLDTVICMKEYPQEDKKMKAERVFSTGGGPVGNALVAISRLGIKAEYLGALSGDGNGKRLADEFEQYGVRADKAVFVPDTVAFTSYIVLSEKEGTRTCVYDRGTVPDDEKNVDYKELETADVLHLDGNCMRSAIAAAKFARAHRVKVSLDAGGFYEGIEELLPYVDILIPSEEFSLKATGEKSTEEAMKKLYARYSPEVLVITQGSKGGIYFENGECKRYQSYKVDCVDSNGAGDTFHGAFLVGYLNGLDTEENCRFASAVSAIKCTKAGVRNALPDMEETIKFINTRS